jgi:hypothetical protein
LLIVAARCYAKEQLGATVEFIGRNQKATIEIGTVRGYDVDLG